MEAIHDKWACLCASAGHRRKQGSNSSPHHYVPASLTSTDCPTAGLPVSPFLWQPGTAGQNSRAEGLWPQPEGHFTSAHHTALEAFRVEEDWSNGIAPPPSQPVISQASASEGPWQNEKKRINKRVEALKQGEHEVKNIRVNQQQRQTIPLSTGQLQYLTCSEPSQILVSCCSVALNKRHLRGFSQYYRITEL